MKQHITPKQLNELSESAKNELRKWWKPKGNEYLYSPSYEGGQRVGWSVHQNCDSWAESWNLKKMQKLEWVRDTLPLLSIGLMIEFLCDHQRWPIITMVINNKARIKIPMRGTKDFRKKWHDIKEVELVDTLWRAVREVLKAKSKH